ncbi:MAG: hypothetical protein EHM81_09875, partial [Chloroflexi bacterium]
MAAFLRPNPNEERENAMTQTSSRLLRHTRPLPGESLPSWLLRLGQLNSYTPLTIINGLCLDKLEYDRIDCPLKAVTYQRIATLTRLDPTELYTLTSHRLAPTLTPPTDEPEFLQLPSGETVPALAQSIAARQLYPLQSVQFCPVCLKDAAYHRLDWLPLAAAVCLRHHTLLVQRCPKCSNKLNVLDIIGATCQECQFRLTHAPVVSVAGDEFGLFSQAVVQHWLGLAPAPAENHGLPEQPPTALYRTLDGLRRAVMMVRREWTYLHPCDLTADFFPCRGKQEFTPAKIYVLYATACKGLIEWPRGFWEFLDAYKKRDGRTPQGQILPDLGILHMAWLERKWRHPLFDFVQEAFDQYLLDNHNITPSLLHLRRVEDNTAFRARFTYLTEADAARLLGTTGGMVKRLVGMGFLVSYQEAEKDT